MPNEHVNLLLRATGKNIAIGNKNQRYRSSESDAERLQRLAADKQQKANCRASESEAQCKQHLSAGQQRVANRTASESEA